MPYRTLVSGPYPRFNLLPHEDITGHEDGDFIPVLEGVEVGDFVLIDDYLTVYEIVGEGDPRGHQIRFSHRRPEPEWVD